MDELTANQIDNALIALKQKEIDEQIRSNKVIEGVFKDISLCFDRMAGDLGDINIREELKSTLSERDMMDEKGNELTELHGSEMSPIDILAEIASLLKQESIDIVNVGKNLKLMNENLIMIASQISDMNTRLGNMAQQIKAIAEAEAETEPVTEPENPVPICHLDRGNGFAICGGLGTPSQPFAARMNEPVSSAVNDITCPDCLKIIAQERSEIENLKIFLRYRSNIEAARIRAEL